MVFQDSFLQIEIQSAESRCGEQEKYDAVEPIQYVGDVTDWVIHVDTKRGRNRGSKAEISRQLSELQDRVGKHS